MDDSFNSEKHHETSDESYEHDNPARSHYPHHQHHQPVIYERPKGLKGFYQHPTTQVCLLGALIPQSYHISFMNDPVAKA